MIDALLIEWLGTYLIHSTLAIGLASLLVGLLRGRDSALASMTWKVALLVALPTASVQTLTPLGSPLQDLRSQAGPVTVTMPARSEPAVREAPIAEQPVSAAATSAARSTRLPTSSPLDPWLFVLLGWVAGSAIMGIRLIAASRVLRQTLADRRPVEDPDLRALFRTLAQAAGVPNARLSQSSRVRQPLALLGGEVCVPADVSSLPRSQRQALLAHELAHVAHADPEWRWASRILEALLFIQPLNILAVREIDRHGEILADARATDLGSRPADMARCLHRYAEVEMRALPAVACGMFGRPGRLLERVQVLVEERHRARKPRHLVPTLSVCVLAGVLILPGVSSGFEWRSRGTGTSIHVDGSDGETRIQLQHRTGSLTLSLDAEGRLTFADDESDLMAISDGGRFDLEVREGGVEERFLLKGLAGSVERRYWRNGDKAAFDETARARLAGWLPVVFRVSGIDSRNRVARLVEQGGPGRVLDEVDLIDSDRVARIYLGRLSETARLSGAELERAIEQIDVQIGSDLEQRLSLVALMTEQTLEEPAWVALLEASRAIGSDLEQRLVLAAAADILPDGAKVVDAYLDAVTQIGSDLEQRLALIALAERDLDDEELSRLIRTTREIGSDLEQRLVLQSVASQAAVSPAAADYIAATESIGSDLEARLALEQLVSEGLDAGHAVALVETAAEHIASNLELRLVLDRVLNAHLDDEAVRDAVLAATDALSGHERELVLRRLTR